MLHTRTYSVRKQQTAESGGHPACLFLAPPGLRAIPGARDLPPSRNPILPHFVLALKTHLWTHRFLAQVKSSSRSAHRQELPAAFYKAGGKQSPGDAGREAYRLSTGPKQSAFCSRPPGLRDKERRANVHFPAV